MNWKFWQKKETVSVPTGGKSQRPDRPRDLPQEVGRHLVVEQNLDPDWIWSLKCVRKPRENSKSTYDIRIFSPETLAQHGLKVREYASLDNHMDLIIYSGWYDKKTLSFQLERLIEEAV